MSGAAAAVPLAGGEKLSGAGASEEGSASPTPEELPPVASRWITPPPELVLGAGAADRARGMARPAAVAVRFGVAGGGAGSGAAAVR